MEYRFVVNTANGVQNFLKIESRSSGDVIVSPRLSSEALDLNGDLKTSQTPDLQKIRGMAITIHPNLKSKIGSISVNYKTLRDGKEESREVQSALDVKHGLRLFPILLDVGENVGSPRLTIDPKKPKYGKTFFIDLWPGQVFDWSIQSLGYWLFVANPEVSVVFPQSFPREVRCFKFPHLQLIFMYWALDVPTKGAGTRIQLFSPPDLALPGLELSEVVELTTMAINEHLSIHASLPDFLFGQLPENILPQPGMLVVNNKWHFKEFSFSVQTIRDESVLRLNVRNVDGNVAVIDFRGNDILEFQRLLNEAIARTPGLAAWRIG